MQLLLAVAATTLLTLCNAAVLTVEPGQSIQDALDLAQPGDTVELQDGEYREDLVTVRDGEPDKRIVISGSRNAVLKGTGKESRLFQCFHSYITIDGFTIDGQFGEGDKAEQYTDKLLYIMGGETRVINQYGTEFRSGVDGVIVSNMKIVNAQGECLRARYFVTNLEIVGCHIENCGVEDFVFGDMKAKNGEVIYLGTSSNQLSDGKNPTDEIDQTRYVWIHDCVFKSEGNEVDAKEGSEYILIEHNSCSTQKDPDSACLDTRSDHVVFRYNTLFDNDGSGVRIGGHTVDGKVWGLNNEVYANTFHNNKAGALKIQTGAKEHPHLCQNECKGGCKVSGSASEGNEDIEKKCGDGVMDIFWVDPNRAVPVAQSVRSAAATTAAADDGGEPQETQKKTPEPEFETTVSKSSKKPTESDKCYPVPIKDVGASSEQGKHTVHAAIDGKSLTRWSSEGKGEWLKIELEAKTKIDAIEISFFKGDERTQDFEVAVDGSTKLSLKKQQSSGKTLAMQRFPFPKEVEASTVTITGGGNSENDWNSLTEVVVCGVDEPEAQEDSESGEKNNGEVLLCDKVEKLKIDKVSASADDGDKFEAENLVDGDLKTRWSAEGLGEEEVKITLEKPSTVSEIGLAVYKGDKVRAFFDVMVETEEHGWEEVVRDGESVKGKGIESYDLGMKGVKQVKVVGYAAEDLESGEQVGLNSFAEIELYGC